MPRANRTLEEGRIYHVYNRVGGDGEPFFDEALAARFVQLLRQVVERDGLVIFAWVLMGNHYHLAVRMGVVSLSRSMKTLPSVPGQTIPTILLGAYRSLPGTDTDTH